LGVAGGTDNHAYPRYVFSAVRAAERNRKLALGNLERAFDAPEQSLVVYRLAATLHMRDNDPMSALGVLEEGYQQLDQPVQVMPELIDAYTRVGNTGKASAMTLECMTRYPDWAERCSKAKQG